MFFKGQKSSIRRLIVILALLAGILWTTAVQANPFYTNFDPDHVYGTPVLSEDDPMRILDSPNGIRTNGFVIPSISADGRYIVFFSDDTDLVPNDTNGRYDVFRYDLENGAVELVTVAFDGAQANGDSQSPDVSADGRYVTFESGATNLVPDDTNNYEDVFVRDMQTGVTTRVSVTSEGAQMTGSGYNYSRNSSISDDGRYITFHATADTLVPDDTNGKPDVFVHDMQTGQTTRVSEDSNDIQLHGGLSISADGRYIAFAAGVMHPVNGNPRRFAGVLVRDMQTGTVTLVSVDSSGVPGYGGYLSETLAISADGRFTAFADEAANLVPDDTNGKPDIFVHDMQTGETTCVSVDSNGVPSDQGGNDPSISADGRYIAFTSSATNLVEGIANGKEIPDVFLHDMQTRQTIQLSIHADGRQMIAESCMMCGSRWPSISADGQIIAFGSVIVSVMEDNMHADPDIYVYRQNILTVPATIVPLTDAPTETPTDVPTDLLTDIATDVPTDLPTDVPTDLPTDLPTDVPTDPPTDVPTNTPTDTETPTPPPALTAAD